MKKTALLITLIILSFSARANEPLLPCSNDRDTIQRKDTVLHSEVERTWLQLLANGWTVTSVRKMDNDHSTISSWKIGNAQLLSQPLIEIPEGYRVNPDGSIVKPDGIYEHTTTDANGARMHMLEEIENGKLKRFVVNGKQIIPKVKK